jgi:hypothetical protein
MATYTRRPNALRIDTQWDATREHVLVESLTIYPTSIKGSGGWYRFFDYPNPVLVGDTADSDVLNKLVCSSATFVTDGIAPGMIAYNYDDHTEAEIVSLMGMRHLKSSMTRLPRSFSRFGRIMWEAAPEK